MHGYRATLDKGFWQFTLSSIMKAALFTTQHSQLPKIQTSRYPAFRAAFSAGVLQYMLGGVPLHSLLELKYLQVKSLSMVLGRCAIDLNGLTETAHIVQGQYTKGK
jgi:hypothetical protein